MKGLTNKYIQLNSVADVGAAMQWLGENGYRWTGSGETLRRGCSEQSSVERYATGVESGGAILYFESNGRIAYGSVRHFKESNYEKRYQKVNLTFQLTVADAVLVPTETPQQAQLREIEEELKRLQQKANELRQQL